MSDDTMQTYRHDAPLRPARRGRALRRALLAAGALAAFGCSSLLDVENPNNVPEAGLDDPTAATELANGVQASLGRMLAAVTTPYATTTDELDWIGSREGWRDFDTGAIPNTLNEFTDAAFPFAGEARYLADQVIVRLERFNTEGTLVDPTNLARAYLYGAIVYSTIGDVFDDFAFSDKQTGGTAIGRENMGVMYDRAIEYLDKALPIAQADPALHYQVLAVRARVKHGKAVWQLITPKGQVPANPLVNDAGATQDAEAALALGAGPDDRVNIFVPQSAISTIIQVFFEVNGRSEMKIGTAYENLTDPITGAADPASAGLIAEFTDSPNSQNEGNIPVVTDRELNLIVAEAALAANDLTKFGTYINAVRAINGLPAWTGQVDALTILKHERKANLFLHNRRLQDLYRFNEKVAEWTPNPNFETPATVPGLLFPIPRTEIDANPCVNPDASARPESCPAPGIPPTSGG
jgi:starch-binding outer membrane protein, SusD/RagB family